jgi:GNAT superfamily N-acetyltransferase
MIAYRPASPDDAAAIDAVFRNTFAETFGHLYDPDDLAAFLAGFSEEGWRREIADPGFAFRLAEDDGALAGYAKVAPLALPAETDRPAAELRQLYVLPPWHGAGIARALMDWVLFEARRRGAEELYLSVFIDNHRARNFYDRYGFEEIGRYDFMVGRQADHDILMRARL